MGKSGVGKSTLINNVFRSKLAETGIGKPVTQMIKKMTKPGVPLTIYDTPGLELDPIQQKTLEANIYELIESQTKKNDFNEVIHCIWYCINCESKRFEPAEHSFIKKLTLNPRLGKIPVILILTQCYDEEVRDKMIKEIMKTNLNIKQIVPVVSQPKVFKVMGNSFTIPQYGLETLIEVVENSLPEILKDTLQNVQIVSLKHKRKSAKNTIAAAVTAAGAAAATPIPFSDCIVLAPIQMAMLTTITVQYGVEFSSGLIADFLSCTVGCGSASLFGRAAVVNLLKFIPGIGSIAGGVVSAGTAAVITTALGLAYIKLIEEIYNGEFDYESISHDQFKAKVTSVYQQKLQNHDDLDEE